MPDYRFRFEVPITSDDTTIAVFAENAAELQGSDSVTVSPAPAYLIRDTFTGPNGAQISSRSPDVDTVGGGWASTNGNNVRIQGNRAQSIDNNQQSQYVIDAGVPDVRVRAAITAAHATANTPGVLVRYFSDSAKVHVRYNYALGALEIYEWVSGAQLRDSVAVGGIGINDEFALDVEVVGSSVTATLTFGGVDYVASYASLSNTTATRVGLRDANSDYASTWDNFEVFAA